MAKRARPFPSAFVIAAPSSGAGKTTVTLGLMEAFGKRGLAVQPFKAGPDYIDTGYHSALSGRASYNLDTWMMGPSRVRETFARAMHGADVGIVEGVMGLFDGKAGNRKKSGPGSTAHLAKTLGLPVVLVVDGSGMSASAAALVSGFKGFDPELKLAGVIFNRVGSERHFNMLKDAVEKGARVKVFGCIPRDKEIKLPERHLGLVTKGDIKKGDWKKFLTRGAKLAEANIDLEGLLKAAKKVRTPPRVSTGKKNPAVTIAVTIAVARDDAFCFYYRENLELLEGHGAKIVFFSPLKDKRIPKGARGVYLGGGYPELHARSLSANTALRKELKTAALSGLPVYAECGGMIYLGKGLKDTNGKSHAMAGLFPWITKMDRKLKGLGYREVTARSGCPFLKAGAKIRGHEHRYSDISPPPRLVKRAYTGAEGYTIKNTLASYVHLHFASNPGFAKGFIEACNNFG
ncbi:MAG: cobyrinate a,c-diamide synthase [Thermodesulfobacteriota bacterium]